MSEASAEVAVLGLGGETTTTLQQTAFALLSMLQQQRLMSGRDGVGLEAWSDVEASDRRTARQIRVAEPDVRLMGDEEGRAFDAAAAVPGGVDTGRVTTPFGDIEVSVASLGQSGAWGLRASSTGRDGSTPSVRCVDELTANRLAHDVLRRGPGGVAKLHDYAREATRRAAEAGAELAEPESERWQRAAGAVRHTWRDKPDLAERVIAPGAGQRVAPGPGGPGYNPAFGALAYRLAQLEERGFPMVYVLSRLDTRTLSDPSIRNPAAFAEYLVEGMAGRLPVVNLGPQSAASRVAAVEHDEPGDEAVPAGTEAAIPLATTHEPAAEALLDQVLPDDVWERVKQARGFPGLRGELGRRIERGQDAAALMQHLPEEHIIRAHDPAGYLRAAIERTARGAARPRGTVDRTALADLVLRGVGADLGADVIACQAWPGLATRLADWQTRGLPVADMIADLPAGRLAKARFPAAYATAVLAAKLAAHEDERGTEQHTGTAATRGRAGPNRPAGPGRGSGTRGDNPTNAANAAAAAQHTPTPGSAAASAVACRAAPPGYARRGRRCSPSARSAPFPVGVNSAMRCIWLYPRSDSYPSDDDPL